MTTVLHITASPRGKDSVSAQVSQKIVDAAQPSKVIYRDIAQGMTFLNADWVSGTFTPEADRSDAQRAALAFSDELIAEVQAADEIVIGAPMYNFSTPASLKAWIDLIARAGVTFKYTETGPIGLLEGKKATIAIATGGVPLGSEMDFATDYLKMALGFVGIKDVQVVDKNWGQGESQAA